MRQKRRNLHSPIASLQTYGVLSVPEHGLLARVGRTPLVPISRVFSSDQVSICAKLEWFNPGGSVKMRPAWNMIRAGEEQGLLTAGRTIVDATSGNTGIAYALIGAARGYPVRLALPENASRERKLILRSYGAELILTDPLEGSDGAIRAVRDLVAAEPGKYFYPDQYNNDANWQAHYQSTALEIFAQTKGKVTHFVAGLGTSGTFVGTARRLKELDPELVAVSFMPDSPFHGLEGMKHMPSAIVPGIYDPDLADQNLEVATEEAQRMAIRLAREEGLLVGVSSGAAMVAALRVASTLKRGLIVTIFADSGDKYLSEDFWSRS